MPAVNGPAAGITASAATGDNTACLTSRAVAEAYVGGVCFKLGPPRLIGAELEWLTARDSPPATRPDLQSLSQALGAHAPRTIAPASSARALPSGSAVSLEPGGQIELSSAPYPSARQLCDALAADARMLRSLLARRAIGTVDGAADTARPPERLLKLPRYCAMEWSFMTVGPYGKLMMCNTAATQVSVDAGANPEEVARRWTLLHAMGPALIAAFACSPSLHGIPEGEWASQRMRTWLELDCSRTTVVDNYADYAHWVLDVPLLCVVRDRPSWIAPREATFGAWIDGSLDGEIGRRPTLADLDYHLTTLFPPVRAAGHLEVRYLDAQPGDLWQVPIAAFEALLSSPSVMDEALAVSAPTAGRWRDAAEYGLADLGLRSAAVGLLSLAAEASPDMRFTAALDAAAARCCRGRMPGEQ